MITMNASKKQYMAPQLIVQTLKMERGYAASNLVNVNLNLLMFWSNEAPVELYEDRSGWGATVENNHFWD